MGCTACTEPQCLYKGALYLYLTVELHLYSPYGLYGLYRASVPVQGCTLPLPSSRAIPLLPLWAVRPVQSLSACTRVTFTFLLSNCYREEEFHGGIHVACLDTRGHRSILYKATSQTAYLSCMIFQSPWARLPLSSNRLNVSCTACGHADCLVA